MSEDRENEIKKIQAKFSADELYILQVAVALFKITNPYIKDDRGYNNIDCWLFRYMLTKDVDDFSIENLEWMRRKLLNYRRQIKDLGFSTEMIRTPVSDKAVFGWKVLADSKFLGMDLSIKKDAWFTFKWRLFKSGHTEKMQIIMDRAKGIDFLSENGFEHIKNATGDFTLFVSYYPESSKFFLEKFGIEGVKEVVKDD